MKLHASFCLLPLICTLSLSHADPLQVDLTPIMDASVSEASPGNNYGTGNLVVGKASGQSWESLLRFDLSGIPANAVIDIAEIQLQSAMIIGLMRRRRTPWSDPKPHDPPPDRLRGRGSVEPPRSINPSFSKVITPQN